MQVLSRGTTGTRTHGAPLTSPRIRMWVVWISGIGALHLGADIGPETGHSPDVYYVPFLVTGDPYMLEEMQFQATYDHMRMQGTKHWGVHDALRSHAWTMRTLAHCIAATPAGALPSWLQPKSYWEAYVAEALMWCLANGPNKGDAHTSSGSRIWR